jgi:hypothetical protein
MEWYCQGKTKQLDEKPVYYNPTWNNVGLNPGLRSERFATNRHIHCTALEERNPDTVQYSVCKK